MATNTCEAYNMRRHGLCDAPLDNHGECPRQDEHGDYYEDED